MQHIHDMRNTHYIIFCPKNNWLLFFRGDNRIETVDQRGTNR